jgi:hypothetical protein
VKRRARAMLSLSAAAWLARCAGAPADAASAGRACWSTYGMHRHASNGGGYAALQVHANNTAHAARRAVCVH